jgi:pimeloyl-ACP methyl ester carboxylesterase
MDFTYSRGHSNNVMISSTSTLHILSLSVSPSLRRFDQPLLSYLSKQLPVAQWEYSQTPDEPCSLEAALNLLHEYLQGCKPLHLIGHGTGGLLGLLYARRHPEQVKSLSLLSIGVHPAIDWQAHYYVHRQLLSCSREAILVQMVHHLFGPQTATRRLVKVLEQDLDRSLSPHTLFRRISIPSGNVAMPLMVCGGAEDIVVDPNQFQGWYEHFKLNDRLWLCPQAGYFFHYFHPEAVGQQLLDFWFTNPSLQCSLVESA